MWWVRAGKDADFNKRYHFKPGAAAELLWKWPIGSHRSCIRLGVLTAWRFLLFPIMNPLRRGGSAHGRMKKETELGEVCGVTGTTRLAPPRISFNHHNYSRKVDALVHVLYQMKRGGEA